MILTSPLASINIPIIPLSEVVLQKTESLANKPALIDGPSGRCISYTQLGEQSKRIAVGLARRGFGRGDVLGIFSPNCPEYALIFHGVVLSGGMNTTVNPFYTAEELARQLNDCQA